ncbi:MAG: amidohydrolase family protein, partial [Polyangiaceae bacterium]
LDDVARWMAWEPARLAGLEAMKGSIEEGSDADLIVFDPEPTWTVDGARLQHRHKLTPYDGRDVQGHVERTILRGETIFEAGTFPVSPCGKPILGRAGGA